MKINQSQETFVEKPHKKVLHRNNVNNKVFMMSIFLDKFSRLPKINENKLSKDRLERINQISGHILTQMRRHKSSYLYNLQPNKSQNPITKKHHPSQIYKRVKKSNRQPSQYSPQKDIISKISQGKKMFAQQLDHSYSKPQIPNKKKIKTSEYLKKTQRLDDSFRQLGPLNKNLKLKILKFKNDLQVANNAEVIKIEESMIDVFNIKSISSSNPSREMSRLKYKKSRINHFQKKLKTQQDDIKIPFYKKHKASHQKDPKVTSINGWKHEQNEPFFY